jgi:tetratricopeptide (TPR) repeat protein
MSEGDSIQVLLKAAHREDAPNEVELDAVTELSRLLGGLPLALVHAGNYCDTTKITFTEYLERFQSHRSQLMTMEPPLQLDKYSYSTYTSIKLSYLLVDEYARGLLHLLAFFHPSSIRLDILRVASKYGFELDEGNELLPWGDQYKNQLCALKRLLMPDDLWSDFYIDSLMNQLHSYSLISLSHSKGQTNVTIHPLVQSCVLDTLAPEAYRLYFSMAVLVLSSCSRNQKSALFQHLTPHMVELENGKLAIHPNGSSSLAHIVYVNGNYQEAMTKWEKIRDECRRVNGDAHKSTFWMSLSIGVCLYRTGRSEEAEAMIRMVVATQEKALGKDAGDVLLTYRLLGDILSDQGKTEEAEKMLARILILNKSKYGQENWRTLDTKLSLADNLHVQERYSEAEEMLKDILQKMKEVLGEDDVLTLRALYILSTALINQKKWVEAEDILADLISKQTINYGNHHRHTRTSLYNLTLCLSRREKFDEAERILEEIVKVEERTLGKDHPSTIQSSNQLEYVIRQQQKIRSSTNNQPPNPSSDGDCSPRRTKKSVRINRTRELASRSSLVRKRRLSSLECGDEGSRKRVRRQ